MTSGPGAATGARDAEVVEPAPPGPVAAGWLTRFELGFVAVAALAGVVHRVVVLRTELGVLDADEAVAGLVALALVRDGDVRAFYWGQRYGGTLEPYLAGPALVVFGAHALVLKLTVVALAAACAVVTWRLARRWVPPFPAACAGLAIWLAPGPFVWWSTRFRGFYWVLLLSGLVVLWLADVVAAEGRRRPAAWAALGLAAGIGWWTSPQILFFAIPAALWLTIRRAWWGRGVLIAAAAAVVGAAPWIGHNLGHGFDSLEATTGPGIDRGWWGNLRLLFDEGLPRGLGVQNTGDVAERLGPWLLAALVVALAVVAVRTGRRPHPLVLLGLGCALALWGWFPAHGAIGEGRYVLPLLPFLVLGALSVANRPLAIAVVVAVALSSVAFTAQWRDLAQLAPDVPIPADLDPLLAELATTPDACIRADYWVAYRIAFESGRDVAVAPVGTTRSPDADAACLARAHHRYVVVTGSAYGTPPADVAPEPRVDVGGFTVYG